MIFCILSSISLILLTPTPMMAHLIWQKQMKCLPQEPNFLLCRRPQLMYIGILPIGSKALQNEVKEALPSLLRHNIILKDLPFNKGLPGNLKNEALMQASGINRVFLSKILNNKFENISVEYLKNKT